MTTTAPSPESPSDSDDTVRRPEPKGMLATLEKIGNKLPNPFWLFVVLAGVVIFSSWVGAKIGMEATDPATGDTIKVESLATAEYLQKMVTDAVTNFTSFAPLGLILVCMLGVAVAEYSGYIGAAIRWSIGAVRSKVLLTFVLALAGVTGSVASDAVYVILIPLGAAAFKAVGRNPIVGAMVGFAASSAGFNASLVLNITDVLLAGISTQAAAFVDPEHVVSPLANYFFTVASSVILALIITAVTELFVLRYTERTIHPDDINHEEASFTKVRTRDDDERDDESADATSSNDTDRDELQLSPREKRGVVWASLVGVVLLAVWFALLLIPSSPFRGPEIDALSSPLLKNIVVSIALLFAAIGITYGLVVGSIRNSADIPGFMEKGLGTLTNMMVLFFAVAQFTAYFGWSNLGQWTAITGAEFLTKADLPPLLLFGALVLLVALINLLVTSGSAQWALMAPVVVPMLMYVDVQPEVSQMLFRMGDSPTNIITPMSPYFALALTFLQKYYKRAGIGTLMSLAIPYAMAMLVGWFLFFCLWYLAGIPLGPGVPVR